MLSSRAMLPFVLFPQVEPVPSLLRGFSAPVKLVVEGQTDDQLRLMFAHDSDPFNRSAATARHCLAVNRLHAVFKLANTVGMDIPARQHWPCESITQRAAAACCAVWWTEVCSKSAPCCYSFLRNTRFTAF